MNPFRKVAYHTLGCKLNFSETSSISRELTKAGYAKVDFFDHPDVYVINTCSVTDNADKKCRKAVKDALDHSPEAYVVVIGCYAQLKPKEITAIPGVKMVLGASEKFNISKYLDTIEDRNVVNVLSDSIKDIKDFVPAYSNNERTRSFLKVQDGCDYHCSFCTIPMARGKSRSTSVENTIKIAKEVVSSGVKEIVLTGVNTGDFGKGTDETFFDLLKELDGIKDLNRIRISSIEPNLLTDEIVTLVGNSRRIMPHFHVPLQSGCDEILRAMRRKYDRMHYKSKIDLIHKKANNCCIGVDVIVGYPGETEDKFLETYNFLNELNIAYLHVFTYSERENTTALRNKEVIPMKDRTRRRKMLQILSDKKKRKFYADNSGTTKMVLFEGENKDGFISGFTDNYIRVKTKFDVSKINTIHEVNLTLIDEDGVMMADLVEENKVITNLN